jgi:hypothetical protein
MSEAFVYLWYDSKNRMYYLGKHKGTTDDGYTHSSTIMESFKSDEVPSHMKRRILAYGTHEEMCELEHKLLKNRKAKKWDKYYNRSLGDPRVITLSGEDHPLYKHGLSRTPEYNRERMRKWREENPEKSREYEKKWREENPERRREQQEKWKAENPEKQREYAREWARRNQEKNRDNTRKWRAKKKLEKEQGNSGTLDGFLG